VTWSFSSVTFKAYSERTRAVSVIHTVVLSIVLVPVYVRTVVPRKLNLILSRTSEVQALGTAKLLGISCGSGLLVAVLAGMAVFIVRHRSGAHNESSPGIETEPNVCSGLPASAQSAIREKELPITYDHMSQTLSSCTGDDPEDGGLFV
jgi:hypothetical protein